jgi:hypothetical protein
MAALALLLCPTISGLDEPEIKSRADKSVARPRGRRRLLVLALCIFACIGIYALVCRIISATKPAADHSASSVASSSSPDQLRPDDLRQSCQAGNAQGCVLLGVDYEEGEGVEQDDKQAVAFFERACDLRFAEGCLRVGFFYETGAGIEHKDAAKAAFFYHAACEAGNANACFLLAVMLHRGRDVPRDDARALALYRKACSMQFSRACESVR